MANSGIATMSDFGSGYRIWNVSSYASRAFTAHSSAKRPSCGLPGGQKTRIVTPFFVSAETKSNSPTTNASR